MSCPDHGAKHEYEFQGVVYSYSDRPISGSSAHEVIYEDKFFCIHCLDFRYRNKRIIGDSYQPRIPGSFPK